MTKRSDGPTVMNTHAKLQIAFDETGRLTDPPTRDLIAKLVESLIT